MGTTPLTADQMLAALKKWGIEPKFYKPDWRTHNRNAGRAWGPINGFLVHNFASDISDASSLAYLYNGDQSRGMPGPLSQFAIDDAGTVWVIGWGRANHGGTGDAGFADAMAHDRLSLSSDYKPASKGTVDMNARTYGVEMLYGKAPTQAQRDTVVRLAAALMDAHGYAATSVGAHRESTITRSDPVGFRMGELRTQVAALLKAGPGTKTSSGTVKPAAPTPTSAPVQEDDMPTPKDVWNADIIPAPKANLAKDPTNTSWTPSSYLYYTYASLTDARAEIAGLSAAVKALAESKGASGDAVVEAVRSEVAKAMQGLEVTLTVPPAGA